MSYYFSTRIGGTFAEALERTREVLKAEGFGIISEIDIQRTLKEKIGAEFRPYTILGACNPALALEALKLEDKVGTMLPCNVIVQQTGGAIEVAAIDPVASMQAIPNAELHDNAAVVAERLRRVIAKLGAEQGVNEPEGLMSEIERHAVDRRRELDLIAAPGSDPLHEGP